MLPLSDVQDEADDNGNFTRTTGWYLLSTHILILQKNSEFCGKNATLGGDTQRTVIAHFAVSEQPEVEDLVIFSSLNIAYLVRAEDNTWSED